MSQVNDLKKQLVDAGGLLKEAQARMTELETSDAAYKRHLHAEKIAQEMVDRSMISVEKYASTVSGLANSNQDLAHVESSLAFVNSTGSEFGIGETSEKEAVEAPVKEAETSGRAPRHIVEERTNAAARIMSM